MCGKYTTVKVYYKNQLGSPPHVREVLLYPLPDNKLRRITPACAGSTHALTRFLNLH